jgi:hypothetical protein
MIMATVDTHVVCADITALRFHNKWPPLICSCTYSRYLGSKEMGRGDRESVSNSSSSTNATTADKLHKGVGRFLLGSCLCISQLIENGGEKLWWVEAPKS